MQLISLYPLFGHGCTYPGVRGLTKIIDAAVVAYGKGS